MDRNASPLSVAVGAVIRGRYRKVQMSQARLAYLTGIKLTTLQRLVAGKAEFDTDQLYLIAVVLGTTVASLLDEAEHDLAHLSKVTSTLGGITAEDRYLRGELGIAAQQRSDEDEDEEPDET
jgi:transcriptional regulator with XRE-family HTH domain